MSWKFIICTTNILYRSILNISTIFKLIITFLNSKGRNSRGCKRGNWRRIGNGREFEFGGTKRYEWRSSGRNGKRRNCWVKIYIMLNETFVIVLEPLFVVE